MNTVEISFIISHEDLFPSYVTEFLGIQPTLCGVKGEKIKSRSNPLRNTFWELSTGPLPSIDSRDQFKIIYDLLLPVKFQIIDLVNNYTVSPLLSLILRIEQKPLPALSLDTEHIKFISDLNIHMDVPIYLLF